MARAMLIMLFMLIFLSVSADANATSSRCEGCNDAQFKDLAKSLGSGQHIITSFSTNQIKIYRVRDTSGGEPGVPSGLIVVPVAVEPDMQALFGDARRFYSASSGTMRAAVSVRGDDLGVPGLTGATVYQVMRDFNLKGQLGDRLATGTLPGAANLDRAGEQIAQGLFAVVGAGDASIEITVVLADGGTMVYKLTLDSGRGQYQKDGSRTKTGQVIPEANSAEYSGTWRGGADQPALGNYMQSLGIPVTGGGGGKMTCTWVTANAVNTLTCKLQQE